MLLMAGGSFASAQFLCSNFLNYALTDVLSSVTCMISTLLLLKFWATRSSPAIPDCWLAYPSRHGLRIHSLAGLVALDHRLGDGDRLDHVVHLKAGWPRDPLARTAQCCLDHALPRFALCSGLGLPAVRHRHGDPYRGRPHQLCQPSARETFLHCVVATGKQIRLAVATVVLIVGLAYLMNYSGLTYTIGLGAASAGRYFVFLSPPFWAGPLSCYPEAIPPEMLCSAICRSSPPINFISVPSFWLPQTPQAASWERWSRLRTSQREQP